MQPHKSRIKRPQIALALALLCKTLLCLFITISSLAVAHPALDIVKTESADLTPFLEILEDASGTLTKDEVEKNPNFTPAGNFAPIIGYTSSVWWARFSLTNSSDKTLGRVIELLDSGEGMPHVHFYIERTHIKSNSEPETIRTSLEQGGAHTFSERAISHRFIAFPLEMPPHSTATILTQIRGDAVKIPFHIHSNLAFTQENFQNLLFMGIIYGILIIMVLYNLTIFTAIQDRNYLYYSAFVFFVIISSMGFDGFSAQYLFPNTPLLNLHTVNVSSSFASAFLLLFTLRFLDTSKFFPGTFSVIRWLPHIAAANGVVNAFVKFNACTNLVVTTTLLASLGVGIASLRENSAKAKLFLFPFSFFIAGAVITALKQFALTPTNLFTDNALRLGSAANATLWSLALASRLRLLYTEKFAFEKALLEGQKRESEAKVKVLRTRLQISAQISDKLNSPLQVIVLILDKIQKIDRDIHDIIAKKQCKSPDPCQFHLELTKQLAHIHAASNSLKDLSHMLAEIREQDGNIEATSVLTEDTKTDTASVRSSDVIKQES
jgi:hypothetical protein